MKRCRNCKKEILDEARFCPYCGSELKAKTGYMWVVFAVIAAGLFFLLGFASALRFTNNDRQGDARQGTEEDIGRLVGAMDYFLLTSIRDADNQAQVGADFKKVLQEKLTFNESDKAWVAGDSLTDQYETALEDSGISILEIDIDPVRKAYADIWGEDSDIKLPVVSITDYDSYYGDYARSDTKVYRKSYEDESDFEKEVSINGTTVTEKVYYKKHWGQEEPTRAVTLTILLKPDTSSRYGYNIDQVILH